MMEKMCMEGIIELKEMAEKVILKVWIFRISKRNLELLLKVIEHNDG